MKRRRISDLSLAFMTTFANEPLAALASLVAFKPQRQPDGCKHRKREIYGSNPSVTDWSFHYSLRAVPDCNTGERICGEIMKHTSNGTSIYRKMTYEETIECLSYSQW